MVKEIGLQGTEAKSPKDLLASVVKDAEAEQQMVGEQVLKSMSAYQPSHLRNNLSPEQLNSLQIKTLNEQGVRGKDDARAVAQNELAKAKASKRKKPDKTIEDLTAEGESETIDNDEEWVDFEQQQINSRRKELSVQAFWQSQELETLASVYKRIFPGIETAEKNTKKAHMAVIKTFLKQEDAASRIDLQAAVGLERKDAASESAQKKAARVQFFTNSGGSVVNQHYLEYTRYVVQAEEATDE